jgi:LmbE family N-acetylglucosaminyl deacetylase
MLLTNRWDCVQESVYVPFTMVAFHAHPDDEALLMAGTLARAAAEGHRVVLVVATAGEAGLVRGGGTGPALASRRLAELEQSAAALGCARVEVLGYADSGMHGEAGGDAAFARADVDEAAARLAALLVEERADVLTVYDPAGGYGHPDHIQVSRVGRRAAELAGTASVLESTVDRTALQRVLRLIHRLPGIPADFAPERFSRAYTERSALTHAVDVRRYAAAKRASMAAHVSQAGADEGTRTLAVLLRLPLPLFRLVLGREWYVEIGRRPSRPLLDDVFASVRG